MPRWADASLLIAFGIWSVCAAITDAPVRLRASKKPLGKWQGRIFNYGLSAASIAGGVAIWIS